MEQTIQTEKTPRKKRRVWKVLLCVLLALVILMGAIVVGNVIANRSFTTTFYQITSDKVSDNIRIVELSDLHNNEFGEKNGSLVERIASLHPDLIVYAGDMMNAGDTDYSVLFDLSDQLSEIAPIYACYGNNELVQALKYDDTFVEQLKAHNVTFLSNEVLDVEVKNSVIQFVAVSEDVNQYDVETNRGKQCVESLEPTENCRICLTHYPELFLEKLQDKGMDIAFTGHAHGGQIRIPFIGGLYSTGQGFLPKLTQGVVTMEDGTQVVISRGLGDSSFLPRIHNRPELVVVDICWY